MFVVVFLPVGCSQPTRASNKATKMVAMVNFIVSSLEQSKSNGALLAFCLAMVSFF
jgi:hypothetical protein